MKIVVIGGTGLIGSKLIALLTAQGHTRESAVLCERAARSSPPSPLVALR